MASCSYPALKASGRGSTGQVKGERARHRLAVAVIAVHTFLRAQCRSVPVSEFGAFITKQLNLHNSFLSSALFSTLPLAIGPSGTALNRVRDVLWAVSRLVQQPQSLHAPRLPS